MEDYIIVGKVVYSGLDCEGNVHIVIRNNDPWWAEMAVRFLGSLEGHVVRVRVSKWKRGENRVFKCTRT